MKNIAKKLENIFVAISFAEVGEFDSAEQIMKLEQEKEQIDTKKGGK